MTKFSKIRDSFTFDDVLLAPNYSEVLPHQVEVLTQLTRNISLNIPILSAAMDTITEHDMALSMALEGGLGFIHKNMSIAQQTEQVRVVKNSKFIENQYPSACIDAMGRLRVGAAVGVTPDVFERVKALREASVDVISIDTAHGHSKSVGEVLEKIKEKYPDLEVIVGNIATAEAANFLIKKGADAIKVGIGPGSICTTRIVAGVGVPQLSALLEIYEVTKTTSIPIISDGGMRYSGDIVKGLAAGASCVMLGSMLAGTNETPGELFYYEGNSYKTYRGMGSMEAMEEGSKDRYFQGGVEGKKLVPEGIVGQVSYKGAVKDILYQIVGGLRAGMGYCGAESLEKLRNTAQFVKITGASIIENHPHDVKIVSQAPNYSYQS